MGRLSTDQHTILDVAENGVNLIQIDDLYDKEKYDLSKMEEEDVFRLLDSSSTTGLNDNQVHERLEKFGSNQIKQKEINPLLKFLSFMWNPLSWVMEIAALVSIVISNGGGKPPDWIDFLGIVALLLINSTIGYVEERNAGHAVKALQDSLAFQVKVKRNGQWNVIEACDLVPGDIISLKLGDVAPADGRIILKYGELAMNEAALTGESFPVKKNIGDILLSGTICKQGEAEAIIIATGEHSFLGKTIHLINEDNHISHLQMIMSRISIFCIIGILIFLIAEILVMYVGYGYEYRRGINNLLVVLVGGVPTAMPTVLSVTLAIGAKQLSKEKAIVTHVTAIEELAAVTILCSDKTGTLTLNKLVIDKTIVKQYDSKIGIDEIIRYAAIASRTQNQDPIDACITRALDDDIEKIREDIEELEFLPFNPTDKRTEITYRLISDGSIHRVTKGMSRIILDLCTRDKTMELIQQFHNDVDEFAQRGLRSLAVAIEDIEDEGNGWKLIGLLPIYDPPREDTKETISRAIELGVKVKMITGDQLAIAKETGRRLGMGDQMYPSSALDDSPISDLRYRNLDDLILHADGFSGVYPEHKYEIIQRLQNLGHIVAMTGDGVNDAAALRRANVGIAVADASDAARSASDIVLTEPGLSVIIHAILGARKIFERMRSYAVCTCSITIRILVAFSVLVFAFQFDFPSFMVLILTFLNDSTIMTVAKDRVQPSPSPNTWRLSEIFTHAIVYGIYLALSTISFFIVTIKTTFFHDYFGVEQILQRPSNVSNPGWNDPMLHSIIYLQTSIISQALIFITRSRTFFFLERPSIMLIIAFIIAQTTATLIAVYANWSFANIQACGWTWAGIVWLWNLIWFFPLDLIKFLLRTNFDRHFERHLSIQSCAPESLVESTAKYYASHTEYLTTPENRLNQFAKEGNPFKSSVHVDDLRDFSLVQTHHASKVIKNQQEKSPYHTTSM